MKRAFTLIGFLVVIAIIAILAAILFPVFAQAKAAAKATVSLSNCKQMGTGQLMYMGDSDDAFSPISEFSAAPGTNWEGRPFSYLQQPYMKSWGLVMDPLSPATTNSDPWVIRSQWAMPAMRTATKSAANDWVMGNTARGAKFTGGKKFYYDGIAGVAKDPAYGGWESYGYQDGNIPSMTQTSVSAPADQVMLVQAGTYDMMWHYGTEGDFGPDSPDDFDMVWGAPEYNLYGRNAMVCGPMARVHAQGVAAGVVPFDDAAAVAKADLPTGNTVYVATDGHAKNVAWRSLMGNTITLGDGRTAIKAFWPSGQ